MGPIDYSINVQTPFQAALQGYAGGTAIRDDQLKQQQQQAALAMQQKQQQLLGNLATKPNPTADDYASVMTQIPALAENLQKAWSTRNTAQQQSHASDLLQWGAAIKSGKPEIAANQMLQRADSMDQGGTPTPESQALRTQAQIVKDHPEFSLGQIQALLSANPNGKEAATALSSFGAEQRANEQAPAELATKQAEARIKGVQAGAAPETTALANANVASQIEDRKAGQRIAELNVQIGQANSETQRGQLVLERDKLVQEQALKQQGVSQATQDQLDTYNQSLATVQAVKNHPGLQTVLKLGGPGSLSGKIAGLIPGTDRKDLEGIVDTLKSQQFLAGVKQLSGMGALSNAEGEKIGSAVASLNLDQSPGAFKNALGVIETNLQRAQNKVIGTGKLPQAGGGFVQNVPGIGAIKEGDINRLLTKFPGATRQQVMDYLNSQKPQAGGAKGSY